jgi:hypothetical protein
MPTRDEAHNDLLDDLVLPLDRPLHGSAQSVNGFAGLKQSRGLNQINYDQ